MAHLVLVIVHVSKVGRNWSCSWVVRCPSCPATCRCRYRHVAWYTVPFWFIAGSRWPGIESVAGSQIIQAASALPYSVHINFDRIVRPNRYGPNKYYTHSLCLSPNLYLPGDDVLLGDRWIQLRCRYRKVNYEISHSLPFIGLLFTVTALLLFSR